MLSIGVLGCIGSPDEGSNISPVTKVSPATVSLAGAWSLFDRSAVSGFVPEEGVLTATFDAPERLSAVKIYGSSPYRLRLTGRDGTSLGFPAIDLSKLQHGWNVIQSSSLVTSSSVELRFEALNKSPGKVPEIEFWAADEAADRSERVDLAAKDLPSGFIKFAPADAKAEMWPGECASFDFELARASSTFVKAYLVYEAVGAFRSFALQRSINGIADYGGAWLGDATSTTRTFVDQIDPTVLHLGTNDVQLCVPRGASRAVSLSNVRLIGQLDRGVGIVSSVQIGESDNMSVAALHDADNTTAVSVDRGTLATLSFDRLIAPDALILTGENLALGLVGSIECVGRDNKSEPIVVTRTRRADTGVAIEIEGTAMRCAALAVAFAEGASVAELDVVGSGAAERVDWPRIIVTSRAEHFGGRGWVAGFVEKPALMSGPIRVDVAGQAAESLLGDFGRLLERTTDLAAPWPIGVTAKYPDGTKEAKQVILGTDASSQLAAAADRSGATGPAANPKDVAKYGHLGETVSARASMLQSSSVQLGTKVGVSIPHGAVRRPTVISARHLASAALPPLDPGMINVTAPQGHGYEFLPHGQRFTKPVEITVPYDRRLIPDGMSTDDVHTYYFDTVTKRWRKLDRKEIDSAEQVIRSTSDHFTIMIDAVLAVPANSAPLSFNPTSVSSIAPADPGANIDLIGAPAASPTGDARLSLPIRLPAGRGAFSPSLGIDYSSSAESSWLGVGWNLTTSRIEIDTRWGVPTYDDGEEVRYLLDGEALVPTLDSDGPACSAGGPGRRYHTRVEGAFTHILRCGTNPSNYYFELYDRNGTRYVYGSQAAANTGNAWLLSTKTRPCNTQPCGNGIFSWGLQKVVDVYGNTTTYTYQLDSVSGAEPGRQVYPLQITYTSHASKPAAYSVDFVLDSPHRSDVIVNGRGGFKMVTRRLLRSVRVNFGSERIREYLLTYEASPVSQKTRLKSVQVYGLSGCASPGLDAFAAPTCSGAAFLDEHTFGYWEETPGFANTVEQWPVQWPPPPNVQQPSNMTLGKGKTKTTTASVSMDVGESPASGSVGATYGRGARNESVGLYDVNGDGLPDQLFQIDNGPVVPIYNHKGYFDSVGPALDQAALGSERQSTWGINVDLGLNVGPFNASATGGYASSTSRASRFLTDLDGDGFIDILAAQAKRSEPCPTGQCFTPVAYSALSKIDPASDPALNDIADELEQQHMVADPVIRFVAPYTGLLEIFGPITPQPLSNVSVGLYVDDELRPGWPKTFSAPASPIFIDELVQVTAGQAIYLKLETGDDDGIVGSTLNDDILNSINFGYENACTNPPSCGLIEGPWTFVQPPLEPIGLSPYTFGVSDTVISAAPIVAPVQGHMQLRGSLSKYMADAANVRLCIQRFPAGTAQTDIGCDDPNSPATNVFPTWSIGQNVVTVTALNTQFDVNPGDRIVLRIESDFSFTPDKYLFISPPSPMVALAYTSACVPNENGSGCTTTTNQDVLSSLPIDQSGVGFFFAPVTRAEPFGAVPVPFVSPVKTGWELRPFHNPFGDKPITFAVRSNLQGTILVFDCNSFICSPPTQPYYIVAKAGESISLEVIADPIPKEATNLSFGIFLYQDGGTPFWARLIVRNKHYKPEPAFPFVGGYRGVYATFWNERIPFAPSQLIADYADPSATSFERQIEMASSAIVPQASFEPSGWGAWVAPGSAAYIKYNSHMHAAKVGIAPPGMSGEVVDPRGDLFGGDYGRLSATRSWFLGGSASLGSGDKLPIISVGGSIGGTATRSSTLTTTDVLDVTGDGIADVVAPNQCFAGNLSGATANPATIQFGDAFRRRVGVDYMVNLGATASIPRTNAAGRALYSASGKLNTADTGTSTGLSISRSETVQDLIDINGDGLVDDVKRVGNTLHVRYNFGTSLGAEETIGVAAIPAVDGFQSFESTTDPYGEKYDSTANAIEHATTLTEHDNVTVGLLWFKYQYSKRKTSSRVSRELTDINGDGLPDIVYKANGQPIKVHFNLGSRFSTLPVAWTAPGWNVSLSPSLNPLWSQLNLVSDDALAGTSSEVATSHSGSLSVPWIPGVLSSTIGLERANDTDTYELALVDVTGDGNADHVLRRGQGANTSFYVKRNMLGKNANLLSVVHRPMGGTINLWYGTIGNTVDLPQQRAVLTRVEIDDGVDLGPDYASPNAVTLFLYEGGYYHRNEKEFYGFAKVKTVRADGVSVEQQYNNTNYYERGHLVRETVRDSAAHTLSDHVTTYNVRPVMDASNMPLIPDPDCLAALHPLLQRVGADACTTKWPVVLQNDETQYEGAAKTRTTRDIDFDRFGNVLVSTDSGDDSTSTDNLFVTAAYLNDTPKWIIGRPTSLEVRAQDATGQLLRSRSGTYNAFGKARTIDVTTGTGTATTTIEYDTFGNVQGIKTPPNHAGQVQSYAILTDPTTASYPVGVKDGFGYTSSATYDLRFGVATTETDVNGSQIVRTLDNFGRVSTVRGPYDTASAPGLEMHYYPNEPRPRAVTIARPAAPAAYTGPIPPPTTTVTIADGLGRIVELRKTAVAGGVQGMTTTGLVQRDALGRVTNSYQPFFTQGASTTYIPPQPTLATATHYDDRDRPIQVIYPDGASESTSYAITFWTGGLLFKTAAIDANGHPRESYSDHLGRMRAYVEHPSTTETAVTSYDYLPTGELVSITDAGGAKTEIGYDLRGLRTSLTNPDTGWIQDTYDLMGNHIATIEPNHRALGTQISFNYDRDRLESIDYRSKPSTIFKYGAPGASDGRAGRLVKVYDETGSQEYFYGSLGEPRRTIRHVTDPKMVFDLKFTCDSFGRQLQIVYPDGEVVTNAYDAGGQLASVTGTGDGWSRVYADQILYDEFGSRRHMRFGNGVVTDWDIDPERRRLTEIKTTLPSTAEIQKLLFTYDPGSNPIQITNALGSSNGITPGNSTLNLVYDGADQLTHAIGNASLGYGTTTSYDEVFAYTASHAIKRKQRTHTIYASPFPPSYPANTNFNDTFEYGSRPHLPGKIGSLIVKYDPSGNPISRAGNGTSQKLVWDDDNRLVQFTTGTVKQLNSYDANGLRVVRKTDGHSTVFSSPFFDVEDGSEGIKHIFAGNLRVASALGTYASGTDPVAPDEPAVAYYFHGDSLGSTTVLTDEAGTVHESREYFVDGETWIDRAASATTNKYLFSGKPYDPVSGFYDFGQRFYDPRTSLWLGVDPAFVQTPDRAIAKPVMLAPLAYSNYSPLRYVDPDGRQPFGIDIGGQTSGFPDPIGLQLHRESREIYTNPKVYKEALKGAARFLVPYADAVVRFSDGDIEGGLESAALQTALLSLHLMEGDPVGQGAFDVDPPFLYSGAREASLAPAFEPPRQQFIADPWAEGGVIGKTATRPAQPYSRSLYGGSRTTNNDVANAVRSAGEGQPCPTCPNLQIRGTAHAPSPEHDPALIEHYYEYGGHLMSQSERESYAASSEAFNGTQCLRCQRVQGKEMSDLSKFWKAFWGF